MHMKSLTNNLSLSILELLSVFLPGAIALPILGKVDYLQEALEKLLPNKETEILLINWVDSIGYVATAYFLGYTIYVLSSYLDKYFFYPEKTNNWNSLIYSHIKDTNRLLEIVNPVWKKHLGITSKHPINKYQYCYRRLMVEGQAVMLAEVERYEASSKFFRSMVVVWFMALVIFACTEMGVVSLILLIISFILYLNRRGKTLRVALKNIIILEALKEKID